MLRLTALLALVLFISPTDTRAQSLIAPLFICDTLQQLEEYAAAVKKTGDYSIAHTQINENAGSNVCGMVMVLFLPQDKVKQIDLLTSQIVLMRILVLGIEDEDGDMLPLRRPLTQFTFIPVPERET